eukprot:1159815-Pelagomonas_calceolata.AAC.5
MKQEAGMFCLLAEPSIPHRILRFITNPKGRQVSAKNNSKLQLGVFTGSSCVAALEGGVCSRTLEKIKGHMIYMWTCTAEAVLPCKPCETCL